MRGLNLLWPLSSVLGGIDIDASTIAPYGSYTTAVPSGFHNASSLNYVYYQDLPISYYEYGDSSNPTLIISGGWPTGADANNDFAAAVAESGVHVVLYDQRGSGKSAHPWGPEGYSLPNLANEMGAVIDKVAPNKKVAVWGGTWTPFIASEYCSMYPDTHRIAAILSIGSPSYDLSAQQLIDQTKNLVNNQQNLTEVLSQWINLSYEVEVSVPIIPEVLAETGIPNWFETKLQDGLQALNNSDADALADILGSDLARSLIYDFGDYSKTDTAHGEQKYQWLIFNRLLPGLFSGKMYRQYLPVDRLKVWQMKDDPIQSVILIDHLGEYTPSLNLSYLDGGHSGVLSGGNFDIVLDTTVEWMHDI